MKTNWDLTLFGYNGIDDPKIEADFLEIQKKFQDFSEKYQKNKKYLEDEGALLQTLKDYEAIMSDISSPKPVYYFYYWNQIESGNTQVEAKRNKYFDLFNKAQNEIIFFEVLLGNIREEQQKKFLESPALSPYHYYLKKIFRFSPHQLTVPEEKILNLKSTTSRFLWIEGVEKVLSQKTILWEGKEISISEGASLLPELSTELRRELHKKLFEVYQLVSEFSESEINAVFIDKKINDELRKFSAPYSATILRYENEENAVLSLVKTVSEHFHLAHRFYHAKAKLLNLPHLEYADRTASVGKIEKKYSFDESVEILKKCYEKLGKEYEDIFDRFLSEGHIDAFPKKGKSGGAFCASGISSPTLILLNHTNTLRSVTTFAHEMGHGIHSELSKTQTPLYQDYTTSTAETASTFFEQIIFHELEKSFSESEKVIALHDRLNDDISSIFRQIACFNFELELHTKIREDGSISKENITALLNEHMQSYLGDSFKLKELDGYFFVNWSHIRNFFYVYTYAYGQLISRALFQRYQSDPSYFSQIEKFLRSGSSDSPENIFKNIGMDTRDPKFWEEGLKGIEKDIEQLESLI